MPCAIPYSVLVEEGCQSTFCIPLWHCHQGLNQEPLAWSFMNHYCLILCVQYAMMHIESRKNWWHPINNILRITCEKNDICRKWYWNLGLLLLLFINNISFGMYFGLETKHRIQWKRKVIWFFFKVKTITKYMTNFMFKVQKCQ